MIWGLHKFYLEKGKNRMKLNLENQRPLVLAGRRSLVFLWYTE